MTFTDAQNTRLMAAILGPEGMERHRRRTERLVMAYATDGLFLYEDGVLSATQWELDLIAKIKANEFSHMPYPCPPELSAKLIAEREAKDAALLAKEVTL